MLTKITTKIKNVGNGLFHDSRQDVATLAKQINLLTDKVNELVDEINKLKNDK